MAALHKRRADDVIAVPVTPENAAESVLPPSTIADCVTALARSG